jgi:hypothetical protein
MLDDETINTLRSMRKSLDREYSLFPITNAVILGAVALVINLNDMNEVIFVGFVVPGLLLIAARLHDGCHRLAQINAELRDRG